MIFFVVRHRCRDTCAACGVALFVAANGLRRAHPVPRAAALRRRRCNTLWASRVDIYCWRRCMRCRRSSLIAACVPQCTNFTRLCGPARPKRRYSVPNGWRSSTRRTFRLGLMGVRPSSATAAAGKARPKLCRRRQTARHLVPSSLEAADGHRATHPTPTNSLVPSGLYFISSPPVLPPRQPFNNKLGSRRHVPMHEGIC